MPTSSRSIAAFTLACALIAALSADALAQEVPVGCRARAGIGILTSPRRPMKDRPLRVIVVSDKELPGARLVGKSKQGPHGLKVLSRGGPPHWWLARVDRPTVGVHRFALVDRDGAALACGKARVGKRPDPPGVSAGQWPIKRSWGVVNEGLYSAWVEKLFDAPAGARPSWTPLHVVIRDPARNFLFNHLGADEDGPKGRRAVIVKPDCADLPYFLRAYFSWKMRLPFGHRHCDRGSSRRASRCQELRSSLSIPPAVTDRRGKPLSPARRFSRYLRRHVSLVHSGAGRTAPDDDETDLYPVTLDRASLRPGTVYVDPYGHLLVVARWVNQTAGRGGLLYAVDGHPDLSVGRKRFWKGAFLFSDNIRGGAGGFKAFRPLVMRKGAVVALTNKEIGRQPGYRNHSDMQYKLGIDGFYDRMDTLINPRSLSPLKALGARLDALYELIIERVGSVKAGEAFMKKDRYKVMKMPRGPRIFETRGPWENFSTPARDLRLLIAFQEVVSFPAKVVSHPQRFSLGKQDPVAAKRAMEKRLETFTRGKSFTYNRSDGSAQTVTMAQLLDRRKHLEVAYNPNDCVEIRWGAQGKELETCRRHAPAEQRKLMESYRTWFATRTRPPLR